MARYHMHKQEREITETDAIWAILADGRFATLALARGDEPYVVTLNYGYASDSRTLYFHSATEGLKLDFLRENARICGTVVKDRGYLPGKCSHAYASVVFWGEIEILEDEAAKRRGLGCMIDFLEPDPDSVRRRLLAEGGSLGGVTVLKLTIDEITAKAAH